MIIAPEAASRWQDELERRVQGQGRAVAFACYPTSVAEIMAVADAAEVMLPE